MEKQLIQKIANICLKTVYLQCDFTAPKKGGRGRENGRSKCSRPLCFQSVPSHVYDPHLDQIESSIEPGYFPVETKRLIFRGLKVQQTQRFKQLKLDSQVRYSFPTVKMEKDVKLKIDDVLLCLSHAELEKLNEEVDLNDTLIEDWLQIIIHYFVPQPTRQTIAKLSTHFLSKLCLNKFWLFPEHIDSSQQAELRELLNENYRQVRSWLSRAKIFDAEILIVPINSHGKHWNSMLVLNPYSLRARNHNCSIVFLDSLMYKFDIYSKGLRYLLCHCLEEEYHIKVDENTIPVFQLLLPRQTNLHDCGVYTLLYIEQLLRNRAILDLDLRKPKNREHLDLFPRMLGFKMRSLMRRFFCKLSQGKENCQSIVQEYMETVEKIKTEASPSQFDTIDEDYFKSYLNIYDSYYEDTIQDAEERRYFLKVKYYLDGDIVYFEKDRQQAPNGHSNWRPRHDI